MTCLLVLVCMLFDCFSLSFTWDVSYSIKFSLVIVILVGIFFLRELLFLVFGLLDWFWWFVSVSFSGSDSFSVLVCSALPCSLSLSALEWSSVILSSGRICRSLCLIVVLLCVLIDGLVVHRRYI